MINDLKNPLGKNTEYKSLYDRSLLFPIAREMGRANIGFGANQLNLPFYGFDVWNCYEVSWLNNLGKPEVALVRLFVNCYSPNIIESKSLKLYLNSFNNTKIDDLQSIKEIITNDLSLAAGDEVIVDIMNISDTYGQILSEPKGECIDNLPITIEDYRLDANYLSLENDNSDLVSERLCSNLLRSNCLITNQPDWGTLEINYEGNKISRESLLRYIISFRNHNEFHEQCVERIFVDLMEKCKPISLAVQAKYTRRGGIDINPIRSTEKLLIEKIDTSRLPRQ